MKRRSVTIGGLACLLGAGVLAWTVTARGGYESAPYKVVESDGNIEIRDYPELVLASTTSDARKQKKDNSFMRLFRYISGDNAAQRKIEMTTPVFMEAATDEAQGKMGFVIPQEIAASGAPAPKSDDVTLRKRAAGRFAVIRFSGVMTGERAKEQEAKLRDWLKTRDLQGAEGFERAGYDAPFVPGPLRRNEVLIRLTETPPEDPS